MRKECRTLYGLLVVLIVFGVTLPALGQQSNTESKYFTVYRKSGFTRTYQKGR